MRLSRENIEKKRANTSVLIRKADAFGAVIEAAAREESETDVLRRIDRIPPVVGANVAFLCDGWKCDSCSGECTHTLDVSHAKNFSKRDGAYFENEVQPSADITETEACQKCQEATERVLNRQGDEIKRLKASAEAVQGWIPIEESEPNTTDHVLVTYKWCDNDYEVSELDYWVTKYASERGNEQCIRLINHIVAWQPLPTPYKGGDDE